MTTSRWIDLRQRAFALVALTALGLGGAGHASAQEPVVSWVPEEKARIGVLLEERCDDALPAEARCDNPPVVTSVVVNGPADLAGIASGDTLLAIDGLSITSPEGREALLSLESGVTVELRIGRASDHLTIEVTPEMRAEEPYVEVRTMRFGPVPETPELEDGAARVRIVRIPSVRSRLGEVEVRLDSLRERNNGFVFFHEDSVGQFRIDIGNPEQAEVLLRRIREDGRVAELRLSERDVEDAARQLAATLGGVRAAIPGFVWEHEELAHRLAKVRDSSLHTARVHLDSLVRLRSRWHIVEGDSLNFAFSTHSEADPSGNWAYFVGPRRVSGQVRSLFVSDLRVAGAEFRELHGDLADYFEGTDEGLLVVRVIEDTPASRTGLREGDVVVEVDGQKCNQVSTLREAMAAAGPSGQLKIVWIRKGSRLTGALGVN